MYYIQVTYVMLAQVRVCYIIPYYHTTRKPPAQRMAPAPVRCSDALSIIIRRLLLLLLLIMIIVTMIILRVLILLLHILILLTIVHARRQRNAWLKPPCASGAPPHRHRRAIKGAMSYLLI